MSKNHQMAWSHNKDAVAISLIMLANEENVEYKGGLYGTNCKMKILNVMTAFNGLKEIKNIY